jgi:hypothetical protein
MVPYVFGSVLLLGIPFLLYCLWNFVHDLRPYRSTTVLSLGSRQNKPRIVPVTRLENQSRSVRLREEGRSAS